MLTTITKTCLFCGKVHRFELDAERVAEWRAGAYVQRCFPEMTPDDRETLISGSCPPCFAAAFPDEDEEEGPTDFPDVPGFS